MPGFDGTGPRGMGPMTGGGRGFCNPYSPLGAGGFAPPAYWSRLAAPQLGAGYAQFPGYTPGVYGFGGGVRPPVMGRVAPSWGGLGGFGRGMGMGMGRGMGMAFRGRGRYPVWGW
jgi:hypothetical protein